MSNSIATPPRRRTGTPPLGGKTVSQSVWPAERKYLIPKLQPCLTLSLRPMAASMSPMLLANRSAPSRWHQVRPMAGLTGPQRHSPHLSGQAKNKHRASGNVVGAFDDRHLLGHGCRFSDRAREMRGEAQTSCGDGSGNLPPSYPVPNPPTAARLLHHSWRLFTAFAHRSPLPGGKITTSVSCSLLVLFKSEHSVTTGRRRQQGLYPTTSDLNLPTSRPVVQPADQ